MVSPILLWGEPMLQHPSKEVKKDFKNLSTLIGQMFETMHKAQGISLSAVQIGYPLRLFVIEAHLEDKNIDIREVFINPKIKKYSKETSKLYDGCLSMPGVIPMIERPNEVKVEYRDEDWNKKVETFKGYTAHFIQHEMEHLNGEIFTDKMSTLWRESLEPAIQKIINRDFQNLGYLYK